MKDWAWLGSAVAALGILGTVVGVLIGKRSERRSSHEAWLRENRLELYVEHIDRTNDLIEAVVEFASSEDGDNRALERVVAARLRMIRSADPVAVIGPADMFPILAQLSLAAEGCRDLVEDDDGAATLRSHPPGEMDIPALQECITAALTFTKAARTVLAGNRSITSDRRMLTNR